MLCGASPPGTSSPGGREQTDLHSQIGRSLLAVGFGMNRRPEGNVSACSSGPPGKDSPATDRISSSASKALRNLLPPPAVVKNEPHDSPRPEFYPFQPPRLAIATASVSAD